MSGWESAKQLLEWLGPLLKRGDTYLTALSVFIVMVVANFHTAYGYLSTVIVLFAVGALAALGGAAAYSWRDPLDKTWSLYAVAATTSGAYLLYLGPSWPFFLYPLVCVVLAGGFGRIGGRSDPDKTS
jgi:hypothetical protein